MKILSGCLRTVNWCQRRWAHVDPPVQPTGCCAGPKSPPPWRVLFLGTDEFALNHLRALNENRKLRLNSQPVIKKLEVVVSTKKCPVYKYAVSEDLRVHRWPLPDLQGQHDVGVIVSFGHLIPDSVISMLPNGILNVHPSLLPRWRGAAPLHHTILNGDKKTGVSIMKISPHKFDVGPILAQQEVDVPENCTRHQLQEQLSQLSTKMLLFCVRNIDLITSRQQENNIKLKHASKLHTSNTYIDWENCTVKDIDRQYRALGDTLNLRSLWKETTVRLLEMVHPNQMKAVCDEHRETLISECCSGHPHFIRNRGILAVKCQDGWVGFHKIMIRKTMTAKEFHNGYLSKDEGKGITFTSKNNGLQRYFNKAMENK